MWVHGEKVFGRTCMVLHCAVSFSHMAMSRPVATPACPSHVPASSMRLITFANTYAFDCRSPVAAPENWLASWTVAPPSVLCQDSQGASRFRLLHLDQQISFCA